MKTTLVLAAALALIACDKQAPVEDNASDGGAAPAGRYIGIGIYAIDELWKHLVQKEAPKGAPPNPQAALLADDTEVIVSVDSKTGEVRQCGNYSGYCVSSNPWKGEAAGAPAALAKHAADLAREEEEKRQELDAQARAASRKP